MTREEIKATTDMKDVLSKYGIEVKRGGMVSCPFHGEDKHPSMQIFEDGYKCHTCGEYGDVFSFVMRMEGCSFKEAFKILGGKYEHSTKSVRTVRNNEFLRQKKEKEAREKAEDDFREMLAFTITLLRKVIDVCEPMSDMWSDAQRDLPWILHVWDEKYINGNKVEELNVYRKCKSIRQRFLG